MRLFKYRKQNLDVFWESLDRSRINMDLFEKLREHRDLHPKNVKGLARLILAEIVVSGRRPYTDSLTSRALKKLGDAQDPEFTGPTVYTSVEIPYTKRFTADRCALCCRFADCRADDRVNQGSPICGSPF